MADTENQNQRFINQIDLSGPATDVPHRTINSNRKAGPPRQTPYETHTMIFQPTFLGSKTKQPVETYTRPEQSESISQGGEIQNGDTGNHKDLPPARGVGYLKIFQGCLLQHTNTGTVQEIYEISYLGSVISVQGTVIQTVHSSHGVHHYSKGGETDGFTERYKDRTVPG